MAATRLIALHINKGKTVAQCLADRTDYAGDNPSRRIVVDGIKGVLRFIGDVDMVVLARQLKRLNA